MLAILILTFTAASLISPKPIQADDGVYCHSLGGTCTNTSHCQPPQISLGPCGCPETEVGAVCCVTEVQKLSCGAICCSVLQCLDECPACQPAVSGGNRICKVPGEIVDKGEIVEPAPCKDGIWTSIGCVPTENVNLFFTWISKLAIGFASVIAILLMIFGGIIMILSAGDPKRLQTGKTIFTSAIIGLLFIIFSVFILRLIGVEILEIPGFG